MSDRPAATREIPPEGAGRRLSPRALACSLGVLSLGLFFVPLVTPLLQVGTLAYVLRAAWRGEIDRIGVVAGVTGGGLGLLLFLALQFLWIV